MKRPFVWVAIAYVATLGVVSSFWGDSGKIVFVLLFVIAISCLLYNKKIVGYLLLGITIGACVIVPNYKNHLALKQFVGKEATVILTVDKIYTYSGSFGVVSGAGIVALDTGQTIECPVSMQIYETDIAQKSDTVQAKVKIVKQIDYWESKGGAKLELVPIGNITKTDQSVKPLATYFARQSVKLTTQTMQVFSYDTAAIVNAMVFGDGSSIPEQVKENFRRASLSHIVVVSGQHLLIIASILEIVWGKKKKASTVILSIVVCWLFAAFTGLAPSIVRAAIMFTISQLAFWLKRPADSISSLCFAVILMSAFDPSILINLSLVLSCSAVIGIGTIGAEIKKWGVEFFSKFYPDGLSDVLKNRISILSVIIGAQLGTLPVLIWMNGYTSTYGILSNSIVIPFILPIMLLGFLAVVTSFFFSGLSVVLATVCEGLVEIVLHTGEFFANLPHATIAFGERYQLLWLLCVVVFALATVVYDIGWRYKKIIATGLVLCFVCPMMLAMILDNNVLDMYLFDHIQTTVIVKDRNCLIVGIPNDKEGSKLLQSVLKREDIRHIAMAVDVTKEASDYGIYQLVIDYDIARVIANSSASTRSIAKSTNIELLELNAVDAVQFYNITINTNYNAENLADIPALFSSERVDLDNVYITKVYTSAPGVRKYRLRERI